MASSSTTSKEKMITLKTSDGEDFEVEETLIVQSLTIKAMVEDDCIENGIPLPNVTSKVLAKVIEYLKKHVDSPIGEKGAEEVKKWDEDFVKVDQATLFDLILAANYLNIKDMLDFLCQTVADTIKYKTPEEIREYFQVENDFTPEELEELKKENKWAFDD